MCSNSDLYPLGHCLVAHELMRKQEDGEATVVSRMNSKPSKFYLATWEARTCVQVVASFLKADLIKCFDLILAVLKAEQVGCSILE